MSQQLRINRQKSSFRRFIADKLNKICLFTLILATGGGSFLVLPPSDHLANADPNNPADANFNMNPASDIAACGSNSECFAFTIDTQLQADGSTTGTETTFSIPTSGLVGGVSNHSYNWIVNWGDGSGDQTVSGVSSTTSEGIAHDYSATTCGGAACAAGQYQITIRPSSTATSGWFNAFGFYSSSTGANTDANKYKFRSIDTPFTNLMRKQGTTYRFAIIFFGARNGLGIPTGLFNNISTTGDTNLSYMFRSTFSNFARNSTTATIPADLFDYLDTSSAQYVRYMFYATFYYYGYEATTGTIPTGLFSQLDTSHATDFNNIFNSTFSYHLYYSTEATIPEGLFDSFDTSSAQDLSAMFYSTFYYYATNSPIANIPTGLFDNLDTQVANVFNDMFRSTFNNFAAASTVAEIPPGLFSKVDTSHATDSMAGMFRYTFAYYARSSTTADIPTGLFSTITTPAAVTDLSFMFQQTFLYHANVSTVGSIPTGLFNSIDTSGATNLESMFHGTFGYYAQRSTVGTIPSNLFNTIDTSNATNLTNLFNGTLSYYANRQAKFVVGNAAVSSLTQTFTYPYAVKIGVNGAPTTTPTTVAGDVVYPTYNATARSVTKPTGTYASYDWYYTDGTSCAVAIPTPDCGAQDSSSLVTFPVTNEWTPTTSTEKGNVTYYGALPVPTVTSVSPIKGLTDQAGQTITITGSDFTGASAVTIGGEACTNIVITNSTSLTCTMPSFSSAGAKSVLVTTPGGTNSDNSLYEVIAKYITMSLTDLPPIRVSLDRFSSDMSTATVSTNNPTGYTLSLKPSSDSLTRTTAPNATIPTIPYTPTPYTPAAVNSMIGGTAFWAYRVTAQGSFGSTTTQETNTATTAYSWASVPTIDNIIRTGTVTDDLTTNTPQTTDTWLGVSPTFSIPAGRYQATITYTALATP